MPDSTDVFVIGGGPAGLAAAIAARREGLSVMVADGCRPPIDKACGEGLMPDGLAALAKLGVEIGGAQAHPFRGIRFLGCGVSVEADFPSGPGLGIRRTVLHGIMAGHAERAGVSLRWGTRVEGIGEGWVLAGGAKVRCRWIVGADGGFSRVRRWAGLEAAAREGRRYGFRKHYRIAPWSSHMELHWGADNQVYVTPVAADEVCVAVVSSDPRLRLDRALEGFPELAARLLRAETASAMRGAVTARRRLKAVCGGRVALIGDASGSVDAITGEGLSIAFQQAAALAGAMAAGDLAGYQAAHRRLARRPEIMAALLLAMGSRAFLRRRALHALASKPAMFSKMLAGHVGCLSPAGMAAAGLSLGWRLLKP
ncbi:MAG: NAD(P)/FAD-dependent oxidoreductase [Acidobacteriota bacterium]